MIKRITLSQIVVLILILSSILVIGSTLWYYFSYHSLLHTTEKRLSSIATDTRKKIIDFVIEQKKAIAKLVTQEPLITALTGSFDQKTLSEFIANTYKETISYSRILLVTPDGQFIFSSTDADPIVGKKMTAQDYIESYFSEAFMQSLMTDSIHISEFDIDSLFNEPILFICAPIKKQEKIIGIAAIQINEDKIYQFIQSYQNLGTTGEIVLGKQIPGGGGTLIIAPTRNMPNIAFKRLGAISEESGSLIRLAVTGTVGSGTSIDYRGKEVVGSWCYLPMLDWGLVTKQDLSEITGQLYHINFLFYFALCIFCIFLLYSFIVWHHTYIVWAQQIPYIGFLFRLSKQVIIRSILFLIIIICCFSFVITLLHFKHQKNSLITETENFAQESNNNAIETIQNDYLNLIQMVAEILAENLSSHSQQKDIVTHIEHTLAEYWYEIGSITIAYEPYAHDKATEYYGYNFVRNPDNKNFSKNSLDSYIHAPWYEQTVEKGPQWLDPILDAPNKQPGAMYTIPFYWPQQKKVRGVIAITFNLQFIFDIVRGIVLGKTGYPFLIDSKGRFFLHPVTAYVKNKNTITDVARKQSNAQLQIIAHNMLAGIESPYKTYNDHVTGQKIWIIYKQLKPTPWVLAISFPEQEVTISPNIVRHTMIWLLIIAFVSLLCIVLLIIMSIVKESYTRQLSISMGITISTLLALFVLWFIIAKTSLFIDNKGIVITQPTGLDQLVQEMEQEAQRKNEPVPTPTPVGLLIYSLHFLDPYHIGITARLWQQYDPKLFDDNVPGIQIPNAKQTTIKELFKETNKEQKIIGWKVETLLPQNYNYKFFPFDILHTVIPLEQSDITKNLLLIPDLQSYTSLAPQSLPGIEESLSVSGFDIQQAFFSLEAVEPRTSFGIESYAQVSDRMLLHYNIIMTRDLLNPLVIYFLPLLVILISLFAIFWLISQKSTDEIKNAIFGVLGAYTGLFFALILLHRNLRSEYPVGEILYIEYLFFFTYLTILLFIIHSVFLYAYTKSDRIRFLVSYLISLLFWPAQLILWFVTTIIIFY